MVTDGEGASFDIVKATQYGVLSRVRQLVEEEGHGVNERDCVSTINLHRFKLLLLFFSSLYK